MENEKPKRATPQRRRGNTRSVPGMEKAKQRKPGEPRRAWNPEYAARCPWYPKTPEAFAIWTQKASERFKKMHAEGRLSRKGVPDGWAGRKQELETLRAAARVEAKEIVAHMKKTKMIDVTEDPRAEESLEAMIGIVRARKEKPDGGIEHVYQTRDRIAAANTVLAYTKSKPVQKTDLRVQKAEDLLAAVAEDMKNED